MSKKIIVGSRGSKLALVQTEMVVARIREANPDIDVSILRIVTEGDRDRRTPLEAMAGKGIFVKELEVALLDGRIDLAVHSLKDMPSQLPGKLCLAAVLERADPRDVLVSKEGRRLSQLPPGAKIGTGSQRRAAQLAAYRPDLKAVSIRGNVDTRLNRVTKGELDGVILAAAALERLGWEERVSERLPLEYFLPAVGQGVLAVEARSDDKEIARITAPLNHLPTWQSITAERAFLRTLASGCQAPIAALAAVQGAALRIEGMVIDIAENRILNGEEEGDVAQAEELGARLARRLLAAGADKLLAQEGEEDENG